MARLIRKKAHSRIVKDEFGRVREVVPVKESVPFEREGLTRSEWFPVGSTGWLVPEWKGITIQGRQKRYHVLRDRQGNVVYYPSLSMAESAVYALSTLYDVRIHSPQKNPYTQGFTSGMEKVYVLYVRRRGE